MCSNQKRKICEQKHLIRHMDRGPLSNSCVIGRHHDDESLRARITSCTNYYRNGVGLRPIFRKHEHSWRNVFGTKAKGRLVV